MGKTNPKLLQRRQVVCQFLQENYKAVRNQDAATFERIREALKPLEIEISDSNYQVDKQSLRYAYLWLIGSDAQKREIEGKALSSTIQHGFLCLNKDNLRTWEDLGLGAIPLPAKLDDEIEEETIPMLRLDDLEGGRDVLAHTSGLIGALEKMIGEDQQIREEIERIRQENERLAEIDAERALVVDFVERRCAGLERQVDTLQQGLSQVAAGGLARLAKEFPEFPELARVAGQIKEGKTRQEREEEALLGFLPKEFAWENDAGTVQYETAFLRALRDLPSDDQKRIISQLEVLCVHGASYASLHTRKCNFKLPFTAEGSFSSRGSDELRFTWKKNGSIRIMWCYRKGETRIRQSES
ncbi:hypothetical protein HYV73_02200 [Candidatus Uhrbacteria bacterium]|nr:hypothetical protein [Candidatus Uhrbacteria bacterium]